MPTVGDNTLRLWRLHSLKLCVAQILNLTISVRIDRPVWNDWKIAVTAESALSLQKSDLLFRTFERSGLPASCQCSRHLWRKEVEFLKNYSNHLNIQLVWYSNGKSVSDWWIVHSPSNSMLLLLYYLAHLQNDCLATSQCMQFTFGDKREVYLQD